MPRETAENGTHAVSGYTVQYVLRMLWLLVFVYLDFQTTLMVMGDASPDTRQFVVLKSTVLIAGMFVVALYASKEIDRG